MTSLASTLKIRHLEIKQDAWVTFKMRKNSCFWEVICARTAPMLLALGMASPATLLLDSKGNKWQKLSASCCASHGDMYRFTWKEENYEKYPKTNPSGVSSLPPRKKEKNQNLFNQICSPQRCYEIDVSLYPQIPIWRRINICGLHDREKSKIFRCKCKFIHKRKNLKPNRNAPGASEAELNFRPNLAASIGCFCGQSHILSDLSLINHRN